MPQGPAGLQALPSQSAPNPAQPLSELGFEPGPDGSASTPGQGATAHLQPAASADELQPGQQERQGQPHIRALSPNSPARDVAEARASSEAQPALTPSSPAHKATTRQPQSPPLPAIPAAAAVEAAPQQVPVPVVQLPQQLPQQQQAAAAGPSPTAACAAPGPLPDGPAWSQNPMFDGEASAQAPAEVEDGACKAADALGPASELPNRAVQVPPVLL